MDMLPCPCHVLLLLLKLYTPEVPKRCSNSFSPHWAEATLCPHRMHFPPFCVMVGHLTTMVEPLKTQNNDDLDCIQFTFILWNYQTNKQDGKKYIPDMIINDTALCCCPSFLWKCKKISGTCVLCKRLGSIGLGESNTLNMLLFIWFLPGRASTSALKGLPITINEILTMAWLHSSVSYCLLNH